jgi:glycosyltransferase involved in cell wall biosynthesis
MRIVLELGTSYAFRGPAVGVVRTERKFAEYLLSRDDIELAFCRLDLTNRCFLEIDRVDAKAIIGPAGPSDDEVEANQPETRTLKAGAKAATRGLASAVLERFPESLQRDARTTLRGGKDLVVGSARFAIGCLRSIVSRDKPPANDSIALLDPFQFRHDDVYISMGMDWEYNDFDLLARERQRVGFKSILFCYDTIPIRFPHLTSSRAAIIFPAYLCGIARAADRVVAISETSRRDFLAFLGGTDAPRPPVEVVPLGTDVMSEFEAARSPSPDLEGSPFVLFVSTVEVRKNHEILYYTWERLIEKHGDRSPLLIFVGKVGWSVDDLVDRIRTNPVVKDRIRIYNDLGDQELTWLYRNCLFTVFPSLYEGWGLPVVESLALGKPCLISTAPAVVEASQGMATAIDPHDLPTWVAAVEHLWLDPEARDLAARRLQAFHAQTWREHGEALVAIARELAD